MKAKLTVYRVEQCGYYSPNAPGTACCDLGACLGHIHSWVHNDRPRIAATKTFSANENGDYLPVYSFDIAHTGRYDYLFTTWNETQSDDGTVGAVGSDETVGEANVRVVNLPANSIPGYPTYFWFLADANRLATVRFEGTTLNGHQGLNHYMRGYLERFSPHVRFDPAINNGDVLIRPVIGYALNHNAAEAEPHLRPRYKSSLLPRSAEIAYIREHRARITRVIRKGRPTGGGQATRNVIDRVLTFVGANPNNRVLPDKNFMFEVAYTPTVAELDRIIARWQGAEHESWDDIGFDISGDETRRWLSNSTLKLEVEIPDAIRNRASSAASAEALLGHLQRHRAQVSA